MVLVCLALAETFDFPQALALPLVALVELLSLPVAVPSQVHHLTMADQYRFQGGLAALAAVACLSSVALVLLAPAAPSPSALPIAVLLVRAEV